MNFATLIPAFKPQYLAELLIALRTQTARPEFVLISDDSPDEAFIRSPLVAECSKELKIDVIRGPRAGGFQNFRHLLKTWNGSTDLVHFLCDDDIIYPDFYRRHLDVHATGATDCSISRRWTANEMGQPIGFLAVPGEVTAHGARQATISSEFAFRSTILTMTNWMGEFSNAVLSRRAASAVSRFSLAGISYAGLGDVGLFLQASMENPLAWISDTLGFFRRNPQQHTQQNLSHVFLQGHLGWIALALSAHRVGRLSEEETRNAIAAIARYCMHVFAPLTDPPEVVKYLPALAQGESAVYDRFVEEWHRFLGADFVSERDLAPLPPAGLL